jgi:hypothetical protein
MKKIGLVVLMLLVAAAASAATVGVMKYMETRSTGDEIVILTDKRCEECATDRLESSLVRTFPQAKFKVMDYSDRKGKKLYTTENLKMLPAILLPQSYKEQEGFKKLERFAKLEKNYYVLKAGGRFDPTAEICDNERDDTGNNLTDCEDPSCKSDWRCMEKRAKPDVDVFVMSHCPYGTQMEKGLLPVWEAIGDKVNMNIRFVDYAMHGKKEVDEQLKQYCIQTMDKAKFKKYLECFLKEGKTDDTCVNAAGIDKEKLTACIKKTDKEFKVTEKLEKKEGWKGRFPPFPIHAEKAQKYGVRGSPTLVINDVVVKAGRSPKAILDAVCRGFKDKPKECEMKISAANPSPGFGFGKTPKGKGKGKATGQAKCGG